MAGQDQDNRFRGIHEAACAQLLEPGEGHGRRRFASNAVGSDFGFGHRDLGFSDLFDGSLSRFQNANGFSPRCGTADANGGRRGLGMNCDQMPTARFTNGANEWVRTLGLNDRDLRQPLDKTELMHFEESFANRGTVTEIPTWDDYMVGRYPIHLLQEFHRRDLLSLYPVRIDRVQQINLCPLHHLVKNSQTTIEVSSQLARERAIVQRLGKFAPGYLSFRDQNKTMQSTVCSVAAHGGLHSLVLI